MGVRLGRSKQSKPSDLTQRAKHHEAKLSLSILQNLSSDEERVAWHDEEGSRIESHLTEIAIQLVLTAEQQYRESATRHYQWRRERIAELEQEERKRQRQAEKAEHQRRKRVEQRRIERLLKDAAAFQQAEEIRKYVNAIRSALSSNEAFV